MYCVQEPSFKWIFRNTITFNNQTKVLGEIVSFLVMDKVSIFKYVAADFDDICIVMAGYS